MYVRIPFPTYKVVIYNGNDEIHMKYMVTDLTE